MNFWKTSLYVVLISIGIFSLGINLDSLKPGVHLLNPFTVIVKFTLDRVIKLTVALRSPFGTEMTRRPDVSI
uniref:Putative secreted protein n=1 Tax=Ixodes ricinus TaxID=34613 RepID=A0A6B0U224_IXORI